MKYTLTTILFLTIGFSLFSQDIQKRWSLQGSLLPICNFSQYTPTQDYSFINFYADLSQKNQVRKPLLTLGGSVQASYWFTPSLRVNAGLSYAGYGERYHTISYDDAPTVLEVYTYKLDITNHYLGIPVSFSGHFLKKEKFSLYGTLGCNFEFLMFQSEVHRTTRVNYAMGGSSSNRNVWFTNREYLVTQDYFNGFNPSLFASFGVSINKDSQSQMRIGPHIQYMLRPVQVHPINHHFFNVGLDLSYTIANW